MRIRYTGPIEDQTVTPAGGEAFVVKRLEWVEDVPRDVIGKRPTGTPGGKSFTLGTGLLAQGEWEDGEFIPYWETDAGNKAGTGRKKAKSATAGDSADYPEADPAYDPDIPAVIDNNEETI